MGVRQPRLRPRRADDHARQRRHPSSRPQARLHRGGHDAAAQPRAGPARGRDHVRGAEGRVADLTETKARGTYRRVLRTPGLKPLAAAGVAGGIAAQGMPVALVLLGREATGSFPRAATLLAAPPPGPPPFAPPRARVFDPPPPPPA